MRLQEVTDVLNASRAVERDLEDPELVATVRAMLEARAAELRARYRELTRTDAPEPRETRPGS